MEPLVASPEFTSNTDADRWMQTGQKEMLGYIYLPTCFAYTGTFVQIRLITHCSPETVDEAYLRPSARATFILPAKAYIYVSGPILFKCNQCTSTWWNDCVFDLIANDIPAPSYKKNGSQTQFEFGDPTSDASSFKEAHQLCQVRLGEVKHQERRKVRGIINYSCKIKKTLGRMRIQPFFRPRRDSRSY